MYDVLSQVCRDLCVRKGWLRTSDFLSSAASAIAADEAALAADEAALRISDCGRRALWRCFFAARGDTDPCPEFLVQAPLTDEAKWPRTYGGGNADPFAIAKTVIAQHASGMRLQVRLARCSACVYLNNLPLPIRAALQQLHMLRMYIIVRLAEQNMGIVLCDKAWYNDLCRAHLSDASKFVRVSAEQAAAACDDCVSSCRSG